MEELKNKIKEIANDKILKIVISNKLNKDVKYNKINIELKEKNNKEYYQIEKYTDKQVFHENIDLDMIETKLFEMTFESYKQVAAWSENVNYDLKISKKGKVFLGKKKSNNENLVNKNHNREKNYILKEGKLILPLISLLYKSDAAYD